MLDVQTEEVIRLHDARKLSWLKGRDGGRLDIGTLRRWADKGVRDIVLETVRIGNTKFTSVEALLRFIQRLSSEKQPMVRLGAQGRRAQLEADKKLDRARI